VLTKSKALYLVGSGTVEEELEGLVVEEELEELIA
jgi:hypothetical protein